MNQDIQGLLQRLREAIHEALAESEGVSLAMAALEQAGHCPTFRVDVEGAGEPEASTEGIDPVLYDEQFLRAIGISLER